MTTCLTSYFKAMTPVFLVYALPVLWLRQEKPLESTTHHPPYTNSFVAMHMREINPNCPNFLDKKDVRFQQLHHSLDVHFNNLHSSGIGRQVNHAEVISKQEENKLWESGVLGDSDPKSLQNAVFYTVGKMLCLRGGVEHRSLKLSQFQQKSQPDHYVYVENVSKNI